MGVIALLLSILPPRRGALELYYSGSRDQKLFWGVLGVGAVLLMLGNRILQQAGWLDSVLQWVSPVTTTGFQSAQRNCSLSLSPMDAKRR